RTFPPNAPDHWGNALDLNRWDSVLYEAIVKDGYHEPADRSRPSHTLMWFPGSPLLAGAICVVTGAKPTAVFSTISVVCTLAFWLLLWSPPFDEALGRRVQALVSIVILCWPGAFF